MKRDVPFRLAVHGASLEPHPHHTLLYILTVDNPVHAGYRCMQRATFAAMGLSRGWAQIDQWRTIQLAYIFDNSTPSAELLLEKDTTNDVLRLPSGLTCLGKVIAAIKHSATIKFDSLILSDDE